MLGRRMSAYGHGGNGSEPKARQETSFIVLVSKALDHQRRRSSGLGKARSGATGRTRTDDLRFTKPLLYQLSYRGEPASF